MAVRKPCFREEDWSDQKREKRSYEASLNQKKRKTKREKTGEKATFINLGCLVAAEWNKDRRRSAIDRWRGKINNPTSNKVWAYSLLQSIALSSSILSSRLWLQKGGRSPCQKWLYIIIFI